MKASLFYLPSIGSRAEIEARHGRHAPRPLPAHAAASCPSRSGSADELGYDSVSFTEHHFHIEGFELSNNPVLLDLYFAMQTKRIRVGQLGIVLPASNPIRVAEDIAMLDHMTGGRANAGFARGYQRRWVDVMAQQTHGIHGALPHQHDEIDAANRAGLRGELPHHQEVLDRGDAHLRRQVLEDPGRRRRRGRSTPRRSGARASRTASCKAVGVVPKPLQKPHPPLFQPFASRRTSIRWCAKEGVTADPAADARRSTRTSSTSVYAEVSGKPKGEGMGVLRDVIIADTDEEAMALWRNSGQFAGRAWFEPFGFRRGMLDPQDRRSSRPPRRSSPRAMR